MRWSRKDLPRQPVANSGGDSGLNGHSKQNLENAVIHVLMLCIAVFPRAHLHALAKVHV